MTQKFIFICTLLFLMLLGVPRAAAKKEITLSTHSSEISIDPSLLNADLNFSIELDQANPKKWLLTLDVANLTPETGGFSIDELYLNTTTNWSDIKKFKIKDLSGGGDHKNWALDYGTDIFQVAPFGLFDIALTSDKESIDPQEIFTFTIEIQTEFALEYTEEDFFVLSAPLGGTTLAYGAGYFFDGPDAQSAYGAYAPVPEPATICLLGLGALALLRKRRV